MEKNSENSKTSLYLLNDLHIYVCVCVWVCMKVILKVLSLTKKEEQLLNIFVVATRWHFLQNQKNLNSFF